MFFTGRERELAEITRLVERARNGHGGLLVVVGAAGSGKTALLDAAADAANAAGVAVVRLAPTSLAQAADDLPDGPGLVVIDDVDRGRADAAAGLVALAERVATTTTAVVASSRASLDIGPECVLGPLTEQQLARVLEAHFPVSPDAGLPVGAQVDRDPDAVGALHLAARGAPGRALVLAETLRHIGDADPVAYLALHAESVTEFLDVDAALVQLLDMARTRPLDDATRARLTSRLVRELIGDPTAAARRSALAGEADALARSAGDGAALADALDARLHANWGPGSADLRLTVADEMIQLARSARDSTSERRGLFWRFATLMELRRVEDAEAALADYARAGVVAGDTEAAAVVVARQSMLAAMRGRFDEARRLAREFSTLGRPAGIADTDRLLQSLLAMIAIEQGVRPDSSSDDLLGYARRQPGHLYGATAAFVLVLEGRRREAAAELARSLPQVLSVSGPRTLKAMAELALVAAATGNDAAAARLFDAMLPYRDLLVVAGGANAAAGPVSRYLGLLALRGDRIDDTIDAAIDFLEDAVAFEAAAGALSGLANTLVVLAHAHEVRNTTADRKRAAELRERSSTLVEQLGITSLLVDHVITRTDEWSLRADGDDFLLDAGDEHLRLRGGRGVDYLRALLAAPGREIAALDLVAGGAGLVASRDEPVLDAPALASYRRRLELLDTELDAADGAGDPARAARAQSERDALVAELQRASGLGGRSRATTNESERARVNVTRTLRATLDRIAAGAPRAGAHLQASLQTGRACVYTPAPGGPSRWRL